MGYAVIQACDGGEAFDLHERERPHLVLIDLMMPEVSGFDVVAARNSNPGKVIHIDEKAGVNNARFIAEVRRALFATLEMAPDGRNIDH